MAKDNLLARLETVRGNYTIGLMFCGLLRNPTTRPAITANRIFLTPTTTLVFFPGYPINLPSNEKHIELKLQGPSDLSGFDHLIDQFSTMLLRNLVLDSFELIRDYCRRTGQQQNMKAQPWYHFARLLRNALTHDQCWGFRDADKKIFPVYWKGKRIDQTMDGQEVRPSFFAWFDGCELFVDMYAFSESLT